MADLRLMPGSHHSPRQMVWPGDESRCVLIRPPHAADANHLTPQQSSEFPRRVRYQQEGAKLSPSSGRNSTTPIRWLAFAVGALAFVGLIAFMVQQWEEQGGETVSQIPAGTEFTLAGLAISTIVAALIAKDASRRGMNASAWFVGVFLLTNCLPALVSYGPKASSSTGE